MNSWSLTRLQGWAARGWHLSPTGVVAPGAASGSGTAFCKETYKPSSVRFDILCSCCPRSLPPVIPSFLCPFLPFYWFLSSFLLFFPPTFFKSLSMQPWVLLQLFSISRIIGVILTPTKRHPVYKCHCQTLQQRLGDRHPYFRDEKWIPREAKWNACDYTSHSRKFWIQPTSVELQSPYSFSYPLITVHVWVPFFL